MENDARLYSCLRCHVQVIICSPCDHGNIYCADCALDARRDSLRAAGNRYQNTPQGRRKHAQRQACYRALHSQKVTHQGSASNATAVSLDMPSSGALGEISTSEPLPYCCHFCGEQCRDVLRSRAIVRERGYRRGRYWPLGP